MIDEADKKRIKKIAEREAAIALMAATLLMLGIMLTAALKDSRLQSRIEALEQKNNSASTTKAEGR